MATREKAEAERLKRQDEDVKRALEQTGGKALNPEEAAREGRPPRGAGRHKLWIVTYLLGLVALGALHYAVRLEFFDFAEAYRPPVLRAITGATAVVFVLAAAKFVGAFLIDPLADAASRYNLHRVLRFVAGVAIALIVVSVLFADWYTAAVSFGVLSLVVGLAVQTPFTSLLGWVYILVRAPYRVGDRIRIGDATGDVIDVGYLDTTLWESGGQNLSTDQPSGRVIRFPNT
jgi:small-conductance mechanosensitive channel